MVKSDKNPIVSKYNPNEICYKITQTLLEFWLPLGADRLMLAKKNKSRVKLVTYTKPLNYLEHYFRPGQINTKV